ncbi:hypothetical protein BANRA_05518 [Klebsiella pneumoniae]|nr:hypothetical protein BANRA_05518 [Klebsiella pneumoniae]
MTEQTNDKGFISLPKILQHSPIQHILLVGVALPYYLSGIDKHME